MWEDPRRRKTCLAWLLAFWLGASLVASSSETRRTSYHAEAASVTTRTASRRLLALCDGCEPGYCLPATGCQQCQGNGLPLPDGSCGALGANVRAAAEAAAPKETRPFLHTLFSDNMVLARGMTGSVFGWASKGAQVTVSLINSKGKYVKRSSGIAGSDGRWQVQLGNLASGGPYSLNARAGSVSRTRKNVMVGEVWLASGQSNMCMTMGDICDGSATFRPMAEDALKNAWRSQKLRLFKVPRRQSPVRLPNIEDSAWQKSSVASARKFSAVAFLAATDLQKKLGRAVGIIDSTYGGTSIQQWVPHEQLQKVAGLPITTRGQPWANLFNGMIYPLSGFDVTGVWWYQGETDAGLTQASQINTFYERLLTDLVASWRDALRHPGMHFHIAQLPGFETTYSSSKLGQPGSLAGLDHWPVVRDAQYQVTQQVPNTFLVSLVDLGLPAQVHPPNKFDPARRFVTSTLSETYNRNTMCSGPRLVSARRSGSAVVVTFSHVADGKLRLGQKKPQSVRIGTVYPLYGGVVYGFQLQSGGKWVSARGVLNSAGNSIRITASGVTTPTGVRYGWSDFPTARVFTGGNPSSLGGPLPAIPWSVSLANGAWQSPGDPVWMNS